MDDGQFNVLILPVFHKIQKKLKQIYLYDKENPRFWIMCIHKGNYCKQDCN